MTKSATNNITYIIKGLVDMIKNDVDLETLGQNVADFKEIFANCEVYSTDNFVTFDWDGEAVSLAKYELDE